MLLQQLLMRLTGNFLWERGSQAEGTVALETRATTSLEMSQTGFTWELTVGHKLLQPAKQMPREEKQRRGVRTEAPACWCWVVW